MQAREARGAERLRGRGDEGVAEGAATGMGRPDCACGLDGALDAVQAGQDVLDGARGCVRCCGE